MSDAVTVIVSLVLGASLFYLIQRMVRARNRSVEEKDKFKTELQSMLFQWGIFYGKGEWWQRTYKKGEWDEFRERLDAIEKKINPPTQQEPEPTNKTKKVGGGRYA